MLAEAMRKQLACCLPALVLLDLLVLRVATSDATDSPVAGNRSTKRTTYRVSPMAIAVDRLPADYNALLPADAPDAAQLNLSVSVLHFAQMQVERKVIATRLAAL